nr:LysR family transcriptional regulator [Rhizobium sp. Q54]
MTEPEWDDLKLFLNVARAGGLGAAAARTGISAPTIGRRMLMLERATGRTLFVRSQRGYRLAPDGEVLLAHVNAMQEAAGKIAEWRGQAFALPIVSIGADAWLSKLIAQETSDIRASSDPFRLCCQMHHAGIDFTYRQTDVGLMRERPENGNLAIRKSVQVTYAVYSSAALREATPPWVSLGTQSAYSPADRWVFEHHEGEIRTWVNSPELLLQLIIAGNGRGVLPCFVGDAQPGLKRQSPILEDLSYTLWIVAHDDDRHRPEMRLVMDRLAALFKRLAPRLAGRTD